MRIFINLCVFDIAYLRIYIAYLLIIIFLKQTVWSKRNGFLRGYRTRENDYLFTELSENFNETLHFIFHSEYMEKCHYRFG